MVLIFQFVSIHAEAVVTGSNPDWSLYYSFDDVLNYVNYSNSIADHSDVEKAFGKYRNLSGSAIYPYSISTTSPFKGRAAALDGTRYIEMGGTYPLESLGHTGGHKITISLWAKFTNSDPYGNDCFIAKNTSDGGNTFLFGIWDSRMTVQINDQYIKSTYVDGTNGSSIDVYDSNWHHFAVSIKESSAGSGISYVTLWIDGVKKWTNSTLSSVATDAQMTANNIPTIGMELDGSTESDMLEGYVDELQIFTGNANDTDAANLYNGRFGVPFDFDVWTSSIEDYDSGSGLDDLGGTHDNSDGFLYNAHVSMNSNSYEYLEYPVSTFYQVSHDQNVKISSLPPAYGWLVNPSQSNYEVVFHAGHGHPKGIRDYDGEILLPSDYTYSGSTQWVFWQSCSTMKPVAHGKKPCKRGGTTINSEPCCSNSAIDDICYGGSIEPSPSTYFYENEGLNWFGDRFDSTSGPHAFFGFASIMVFYSASDNNCSWSANNYTPSYSATGQSDYCFPDGNDLRDEEYVLFNSIFWEDVINENTPIWEAYKNAVEQRAFDNSIDPISIEATIAFKNDTSTGFDGSLEQWNSTYRSGSTSSMDIRMDTEVFRRCINQTQWGCLQYEDPTYRED